MIEYFIKSLTKCSDAVQSSYLQKKGMKSSYIKI